jgi:Ca2+-transporting ATPase
MGEDEPGILRRPPRDPREPILGRAQWRAIVLQGAALTAGTFAALVAARWLALDARQAVTVTFLTLAFGQLWQVFAMRGARAGWLVNEVTRNRWVWAALLLCAVLLAVPPYLPPAAALLELAPPDAAMWAVVLACSLAPLAVTLAATSLARGRQTGPAAR